MACATSRKSVSTRTVSLTLAERAWRVEDDGEAPDFIITDGGRRVGIEVVQVFADQDATYSEKREGESVRLSWLRRMCRDYYAAGGPPLGVQVQIDPGLFQRLEGRIPAHVRERLLRRLLARAARMREGAILTSRVRGQHRSSVATLWIRRVPGSFGRYAHWRLMNDAMAWVPSLSQRLDDIAAKKAEKLGAYQQRVPTVALLMVADGALASGLVRYEGGPVQSRGFDAVFLLHHPKGRVQEVGAPAVPGAQHQHPGRHRLLLLAHGQDEGEPEADPADVLAALDEETDEDSDGE